MESSQGAEGEPEISAAAALAAASAAAEMEEHNHSAMTDAVEMLDVAAGTSGIRLDNQPGESYTVVTIFASNRTNLLADITQVGGVVAWWLACFALLCLFVRLVGCGAS